MCISNICNRSSSDFGNFFASYSDYRACTLLIDLLRRTTIARQLGSHSTIPQHTLDRIIGRGGVMFPLPAQHATCLHHRCTTETLQGKGDCGEALVKTHIYGPSKSKQHHINTQTNDQGGRYFAHIYCRHAQAYICSNTVRRNSTILHGTNIGSYTLIAFLLTQHVCA